MAPFDDRIRAETYELLPKTSLSSETSGRDYDHEDSLSSTKSRPGLAWEHPSPIGWPPRPDCLAFPRRWWSGDGHKTYKYRPPNSDLDEESISWGRVPFRGASRRLFHSVVPGDRSCTPRLVLWGLCKIVLGFLGVCVFMIVFTGVFLPSYTRLPEHYQALERLCLNSNRAGRGNIYGEKVFIAATLNDPHGSIVGGQWGSAVKELVDLLGPENVHLSVYENDPDHQAREALESLGGQLSCNTSLVMDHISHDELPHVSLPDGEKRIKRIAFLSEVRNRALRPLQTNPSTKFDKLLYLNDVAFNPIDTLHLLFSTNVDATGHAEYSAACAVDFMNPFKFYDRYASRDFEGHETGLPFYPWFTTVGEGQSRQDVLDQSDAVRVRSCWGGMVAFDASPFQNNVESLSSSTTLAKPPEEIEESPLKFRYETDPFWDASECCLVHADLTYIRYGLNTSVSTGIFMNPYVRVAYEPYTLSWLPYTRRIERLYPFIHNILNHALHMPAFNPRAWEQPGDRVMEKVWDVESASWKMVKKTIGPGRFCGRRSISVLNEFAGEGEKAFVTLPPPPGL
ncbi:hypothetical protein HYFRA_00010206 [Hymenoscyphus fraxineus]|uniref:Glycosyltransferase family 69 protein n=1 Tax=Hymenoscyphus fraxineus TaxID=746836 RepID=A0A9N9KTP9_9HELO|nr:hypothetical protein HYFRA_00010206 [Hymenoscyphus fraxineus]